MILIVDDKAENIFSLRRTLELNGFEVDSADSGEEALKKILKQSYSLIILDVQMPGMDGFEVAEALLGYSKVKDIPIIFLSAVNTDKKFIAKGYTSGGVDYVTKPVDPDIFMLKVKTLHRLYEQNRELNDIQQHLSAEIEVRKQAEQRLKKTMQELQSILESMPQIAFTITASGEIEYVNEQWYAYSIDAHTMPPFHPEDGKRRQQIADTLKSGHSLVTEVRLFNRLSNTYKYHLLKLIPVKADNNIARWVGTFTDIQAQKTANEMLETTVQQRTEELMAKNQQLENSNHELQQFASVVSHDLKEPLRKIQVFSSIMQQRFLAKMPEAQENMQRIFVASGRMQLLINDLLSYSRLSMDTLFEPTDVRALINDILQDLEFIIDEKGAEVSVSAIPIIDAIPGQMRQVFQNLISNSLKFIQRNVKPMIAISSQTTRDHCTISISDNGIGFNEKYADRIFTIFQRLHPKEMYEGTGIGLAIVKKIIEKHNGKIIAQSKEGEGTTFTITLPLQQKDSLRNSHPNTSFHE